MSRQRGPLTPPPFTATLYRVGINFCIDVPEEVSVALGGATHIPVRGTANGHPFRGTLAPRGEGRHRLFLDGRIRRLAGVGDGDEVGITLDAGEWRTLETLPGDLRDRLEVVDGAMAAFEALPPGMRQEMLAWLERAKRPETRAARLDRIEDELHRRAQ